MNVPRLYLYLHRVGARGPRQSTDTVPVEDRQATIEEDRRVRTVERERTRNTAGLEHAPSRNASRAMYAGDDYQWFNMVLPITLLTTSRTSNDYHDCKLPKCRKPKNQR